MEQNLVFKIEEKLKKYENVTSSSSWILTIIAFGISFVLAYLFFCGFYLENEGLNISLFISPIPFRIEAMVGIGFLLITLGLIIALVARTMKMSIKNNNYKYLSITSATIFIVLFFTQLLLNYLIVGSAKLEISFLVAVSTLFIVMITIQLMSDETTSPPVFYIAVINPLMIMFTILFTMEQFTDLYVDKNTVLIIYSALGWIICYLEELLKKIKLQLTMFSINISILLVLGLLYMFREYTDHANKYMFLLVLYIGGLGVHFLILEIKYHLRSWIIRRKKNKDDIRKDKSEISARVQKRKQEKIFMDNLVLPGRLMAVLILIMALFQMSYYLGESLNDLVYHDASKISTISYNHKVEKGIVIAIDGEFVYCSVNQTLVVIKSTEVVISN